MFKTYKIDVENQLKRKIKIIRSDRGREYKSTAFVAFCAHVIVHQTTASYTTQKNGVAESKNIIVEDIINTMLNSLGFSHNLWGETLLTVKYILYKVLFEKTNNSPYEFWKNDGFQLIKLWKCGVV